MSEQPTFIVTLKREDENGHKIKGREAVENALSVFETSFPNEIKILHKLNFSGILVVICSKDVIEKIKALPFVEGIERDDSIKATGPRPPRVS